MGNQREKLSSRLGFILLSAGCAIGIGNVYKFPLMTGKYGGGFFVLFYLLFLAILGLPMMVVELSVGRGSGKSLAKSFDALEKPGQKWHIWKYFGMAGNYALMICYTVIVGWILTYLVKYLNGSIMEYKTPEALGNQFVSMVTTPWVNIVATFSIIIVCFLICALGLNKGVEKVTKVLMVALFAIILGMVIYSFTRNGAGEGIKFYLVPSVSRLKEAGVLQTISAAMNQAFFTLSLGIGSIAIFGSYIDKSKSLANESIIIIALDTFVALMCGFIIFPACFTYAGGVNVEGGIGASFVFQTFASIFNSIGGVTGRILGSVFFVLLLFAALSTVIAVFENIIGFWIDLTPLKRPVIALINIVIVCILALPGILGNSGEGIFSKIVLFGKGIMDLEDALVSMILLPVGCIIYCLFAVSKKGWGFDNFIEEANAGNGLKLSRKVKIYMQFILPVIIFAVLVLGFVFA